MKNNRGSTIFKMLVVALIIVLAVTVIIPYTKDALKLMNKLEDETLLRRGYTVLSSAFLLESNTGSVWVKLKSSLKGLERMYLRVSGEISVKTKENAGSPEGTFRINQNTDYICMEMQSDGAVKYSRYTAEDAGAFFKESPETVIAVLGD